MPFPGHLQRWDDDHGYRRIERLYVVFGDGGSVQRRPPILGPPHGKLSLERRHVLVRRDVLHRGVRETARIGRRLREIGERRATAWSISKSFQRPRRARRRCRRFCGAAKGEVLVAADGRGDPIPDESRARAPSLHGGRSDPDRQRDGRASPRACSAHEENFLFAGSDAGGERAAIAFTILGCCQLVGVNPVEYLRDVLPRLARKVRLADVPDLMPARWQALRATAAAPAAS